MEVGDQLSKVDILNIFLEYNITMPSMYARGILFGKMVLELGDSCVAKNEQTGARCDIEFKTKVHHDDQTGDEVS